MEDFVMPVLVWVKVFFLFLFIFSPFHFVKKYLKAFLLCSYFFHIFSSLTEIY